MMTLEEYLTKESELKLGVKVAERNLQSAIAEKSQAEAKLGNTPAAAPEVAWAARVAHAAVTELKVKESEDAYKKAEGKLDAFQREHPEQREQAKAEQQRANTGQGGGEGQKQQPEQDKKNGPDTMRTIGAVIGLTQAVVATGVNAGIDQQAVREDSMRALANPPPAHERVLSQEQQDALKQSAQTIGKELGLSPAPEGPSVSRSKPAEEKPERMELPEPEKEKKSTEGVNGRSDQVQIDPRPAPGPPPLPQVSQRYNVNQGATFGAQGPASQSPVLVEFPKPPPAESSNKKEEASKTR